MNCRECEETIINPICPDCLSEGIACWVGERLGPEAASAVFDITDALAHRHGDVSCIKCDKHMQMCAYCYTNNLMGILKSHPAVLVQFLYYFGYDFEKQQQLMPQYVLKG
jgi:hypothetical protein